MSEQQNYPQSSFVCDNNRSICIGMENNSKVDDRKVISAAAVAALRHFILISCRLHATDYPHFAHLRQLYPLQYSSALWFTSFRLSSLTAIKNSCKNNVFILICGLRCQSFPCCNKALNVYYSNLLSNNSHDNE